MNLIVAETIFLDNNFRLNSELVWVGTSVAYSFTLSGHVANGRGFPVDI